jgi:hypothetical protein
MKALVSKVQDAMTPKKKLTRKQTVAFRVILGLLAGLAVWFGYYYEQTGRYPLEFLNRPESILPPQMHSENQTYQQVIDFVRSDDTDTMSYEFGFNCVDATFRIWRSAAWHGIAAYPIVIQYNESPGHMVIAFPTNDRGVVFIEPQNDMQIRPRVGQDYDGEKVRGFYVLDYNPLPLDASPPYDFNITAEVSE